MDHRLHLTGMSVQPDEHLFGGHEIGDGMLGQVAPLAQLRAAQTVAYGHLVTVLLAQGRDNIRADKACAAGDQDELAGHDASETGLVPAIRAMAAVVEKPSTISARRTWPP